MLTFVFILVLVSLTGDLLLIHKQLGQRVPLAEEVVVYDAHNLIAAPSKAGKDLHCLRIFLGFH